MLTDMEYEMLGRAIGRYGVTTNDIKEIMACDSLCQRGLIYYETTTEDGRWYRTAWGPQKADAMIVLLREDKRREAESE